MLRHLSADFFARSPVLAWPIVALGIFFIVFIVVSARALLRDRTSIQRLAELPFGSSQENQERDHD